MNRRIKNEQGVRIIDRDGLNIGRLLAGAPECTSTGAKLAFIPEGGWMLMGYDLNGEDIDLRHWN